MSYVDLSRVDVRMLELLIEDIALEAWHGAASSWDSPSKFVEELREGLRLRRAELERVVGDG